jgi:uncharacterized protein
MSFFSRFFKPREDKFFKLIIQQAEETAAGLEQLVAFMQSGDSKTAKELQKIEKQADETRRILIDELNHNFVTPIDREDIFALSRVIDDIMDYAYSTVDEMSILKVEPNPFLNRMASLLHESSDEIFMAVKHLKEHPVVANEHAQRAKALENRVETVYREAIADLFKGPENAKHIYRMLKLREVYRHLSNAADRCDDAANIIGNIFVKAA